MPLSKMKDLSSSQGEVNGPASAKHFKYKNLNSAGTGHLFKIRLGRKRLAGT